MANSNINHYENFPVASFLLPRQYRKPIAIIYHFARSADDIADEGDLSDAERLKQLSQYHQALDQLEQGELLTEWPMMQDLGQVIQQHQLPWQLFHDLLSAFEQDIGKKRYENFGELADYCRRSANPIGRLLLHLFQQNTPRHMAFSDGICTSLQLINFWQDIAIDWQKGRIYLPAEDMKRFGVTEADLANHNTNNQLKPLMLYQIEQTRKILQAGAPLGLQLPGRLGLEIRATIAGGARILEKLHKQPNVFLQRPKLNLWDWIIILKRAFFKH